MKSEIYFNGDILTMEEVDGEHSLANAPEAVLVENGYIKEVGPLDRLKACAGGRIRFHDLKGRCLMPSFIDSHSHFVMNAHMTMCADLSECASFADVVDTLRDYISENRLTEKNCVIGFGYDHNFLKEQAHPDKRILDQVSAAIPILILHVSGHLACANSAALRLAGIDEKTEEPEGGHIGRLEGGNEPSGYLEEAALFLVQTKTVTRVKKDIRGMLRKMNRIYLQHGVTTVQDGATASSDFKELRLFSKLRLLKPDIVCYPIMTADGRDLLKQYPEYDGKYKNHLKIGGYKLILDGSPQGRTAWLSEAYEGQEDYRGYPWLKDEVVEECVLDSIREGKQLLAHCNGDAASEQFLNAYEKAVAAAGGRSGLRPVMIHCQTVRNDQLDRMAKLNMIASVFVGHVWYWGDVHVKNLGAVRGNRISPVRDMIDRKINFNFHQDTPVTKPDMLHSVWCAVCRRSRGGNVIGEDQKIPVYEALKAVTINAAFEYFEENSKGSILPGKRADMVILSENPLRIDPERLRQISVLKTIKDGKVIYQAEGEA